MLARHAYLIIAHNQFEILNQLTATVFRPKVFYENIKGGVA